MASRSRPEEIVREALDDECVPLGDYKARPDKDGFVSRIPSVAENHAGVSGETTFKKYLHSETGAIISIPVGPIKK